MPGGLHDRMGNVGEDRIDVGFRLGVSPREGVVARRLFPVQLVTCASPDYVRAHGSPNSPGELQSHRCSVSRHPATGAIVPWRMKVGEDMAEQPVVPALCTNDEWLDRPDDRVP